MVGVGDRALDLVRAATARGGFYGDDAPLGGVAKCMVKTASAIRPAEDSQCGSDVAAIQNCTGDKMSGYPGSQVFGPDVVDGLNQAGIVNGQRVSREHAGVKEA